MNFRKLMLEYSCLLSAKFDVINKCVNMVFYIYTRICECVEYNDVKWTVQQRFEWRSELEAY